MAERGELQARDLLWKPGYDSWIPASAVPGLLKPPPPPTGSATDPLGRSTPDKAASAKGKLWARMEKTYFALRESFAIRVALVAASVLVAALIFMPSSWRQIVVAQVVMFLPAIVIGAIIGFLTYSKELWWVYTARLAVVTAVLIFNAFRRRINLHLLSP